MQRRSIALISLFLFALFIILPSFAHAQDIGPERVLQITTTPENPTPNSSVDISIENYTYDLNKAEISWYVNGSLIAKGVGKKTFTAQIGAAGTQTIVKVSIKAAEGVTFEESIPFAAADVDLVWEASTYVPFWYKGKALVTPEATAHVIALPRIMDKGVMIEPSDLIYTWKDNDSVMKEQSGYGQQVYYFKTDIIARPHTISVTVTTRTNSVTAYNEIVITPEQPALRIYENSPLYGTLFEKSINNTYVLNKEEVTFEAVPFFYSVDNAAAKELIYSWFTNNNQAKQTTPFITLRNDGKEGVATLSLQLEHINYILQAAETNFSIQLKSIIRSTKQSDSVSI